MEFKDPLGGKNVNNRQNVNETGPSMIVCKDLCDRRDLKIKEAEKTIANKDVIIKMLQGHLKKLEQSYKHNLEATENFRYKYWLASEQVKRLRANPKHYTLTTPQQKDEREQKETKTNLAKPNKLVSFCPEDCTVHVMPKCTSASKQGKTLEQFKKDYYEMIQNLVEKILEQKNIAPKENQTDFSNIFTTMNQLQQEINRLKDANEKLQEQFELCSYKNFPPIKDSIVETYHKKNTELQSAVSKLQNLVPGIVNEKNEDVEISNLAISFEETPEEISYMDEEMQLLEKNGKSETQAFIIRNKIKENQIQSILRSGSISKSSFDNEEVISVVNNTTEAKKERSSIVYETQIFNVSEKRSNTTSPNTCQMNLDNTIDTTDQTINSIISQKSSAPGEKRMTNDSSQKSIRNNGFSNVQIASKDENESRNVSVSNNFKNENVRQSSFIHKSMNQNESRSCNNPKCLGKRGKCGCNFNAKRTVSDCFKNKNTISTNTETIINEDFEKLKVALDGFVSSKERQMKNGSSKQVSSSLPSDVPVISGSFGLHKTEVSRIDEERSNDKQMKTTDGHNETRIIRTNPVERNVNLKVNNRQVAPETLKEAINSLDPTISETFQARYASASTMSDHFLVDLSSHDITGKTVAKTEEETKSAATKTRFSKEFTTSMLASTLTEIKTKIVEFVDKQDSACKELEEVKNQMLIAQDKSQSFTVQISKLTKTVEEQKGTFVVKFQENKTVIDELKQTNDKIKMELNEIKDKIETLFGNVNELNEKQKSMDRIKLLRKMSDENDMITIEECKQEMLRNESNKEKKSSTSEPTFIVTETVDLAEEEKLVSSKMPEYNALKEHLFDLEKEKVQKDKQITCLNELICSYNKINNNVATMYPDVVLTDTKKHMDEFRYNDNEIQDYIEKIREENHKLKTTISCVIDHLQEKMKELHLNLSGDNLTDDSITNDSCTCNSESSSTCLNRVRPHQTEDYPETQIEDIYNAVLRSVAPFKKCDEATFYSCKSVKSITCCCNMNIEHFVDRNKSGEEVNIEDVYKAVLCSCNANDSGQQKPITCVDKIRSKKSVKSKDISCSQTSCSCLIDLEPNFADGNSIVTNLQSYVQYLHEQLQVITNIENQIEDLRIDIIKNPQS